MAQSHVVIERVVTLAYPLVQTDDPRFFSFNSTKVRAIFVTLAMGRCSLAPARRLGHGRREPAARRSGITHSIGARSIGGAEIAPRL